MFSGFVIVTIFVATGSWIGTDLITTGMVIKKMINSTSMVSTSGVVLMVELISSPSSPPLGKLIDMSVVLSGLCALAGLTLVGRQQIGLQIAGEGLELLADHLVAANEVVVAKHRRNRDRQAESGHDQSLTNGSRDLVDRGLTGDADGSKRVQDAPHGSEQTDEGSRRTNRGKEGDAATKPGVFLFHRAIKRELHPIRLAEHPALACHGLLSAFRNVAEYVVLAELLDTVLKIGGRPELLLGGLGLAQQTSLLNIFGHEDVPGAERHHQQQCKDSVRNQVAILNQRAQAV